jgi:endonuclease/exonuclease/phosphatase (EEP) superfamily protein YafD
VNAQILFFAVFLTVATLVPFIKREEWWIRDWDFPRAQILVLGIPVAAAFPAFTGFDHWWKIAIFAGLLLALIYQARRVLPYTRLSPREVLPAENAMEDASVSLFVANVLMTNRKSDGLLRMIKELNPDIVLLLEPDSQWEAAMRPIEERYPHTVRKALDNTYGMLLYSSLELIDPEVRYLVKDDIPSMHMQVKLRDGQQFHLHCVHPEPPSPTEADESTERDAELLLVGKTVKERNEEAIVCGDLNDVAWSLTTALFQKISGLLDPRKGRGMFNTFNAKWPFMRWPLDHIFVSEHFRFGELRRLDAFGSDHFPVYARMILEPENAHEHDKPEADAGDREEASDKLQKASKKN